MAHHKRRPLLAVAPLFALLAIAVARSSASTTDEPPFSSNPTVVHGSEHLGWEEAVTDGSGGVGFQYLVYVDGKSIPLLGAQCHPDVDGNIDCTAELPSMTAGPHRLRLSTVRLSPGPSESPESAPVDIFVEPWTTLSTGTRAAAAQSKATPTSSTRLTEQTLISGLDGPSAITATPDGRVFLVERSGNVRVWQKGAMQFPIAFKMANAAPQNGGSLFGIAADPDFASNHRLYVAYTSRGADGTLENQIVRFRELNNTLGEAAAIFTNPVTTIPSAAPRVAFGPDNKLYAAFPGPTISTADYAGKVLRLNVDGSTPPDNPSAIPIFTGREGTVLAFAWQPSTQEFWELYRNQVGELVLGAKAPDTPDVTPIRLLTPTIEPSAMVFYGFTTNAPFPRDLLIATESGEQVLYVTLDPAKPNLVDETGELLTGHFGRISDVAVTLDGTLYVCTNNHTAAGGGAPADDRLVVVSLVH